MCENGRYFVEGLSEHNPTFCDGRPVEGRAPLRHQSLLQAVNRRFLFLERAAEADGLAPGRTCPRRRNSSER